MPKKIFVSIFLLSFLVTQSAIAKFYFGLIPVAGTTSFEQTGTQSGSLGKEAKQVSGGAKVLSGFNLGTPQIELRGDFTYLTPLKASDSNYKMTFSDLYGESRVLFWNPKYFTLGLVGGIGSYSMDTTPKEIGYSYAWGTSVQALAVFNLNTFILGNFTGEVSHTFFHGIRGFREDKVSVIWDVTITEIGDYDYYPYRFQKSYFNLFFNYTNREIPLAYGGVNYVHRRNDFLAGLILGF